MRRSIQIMFIIILLTFTYLNTSSLSAQEITGLEIYPKNITSNDEVLLIISTSFPFLDCSLDSVHEFTGCGALSFDGFYNTGFEVGECSRTDTINMGMLANGLSLHMDQIRKLITHSEPPNRDRR